MVQSKLLFSESNDFQEWNRLVLDWDIEYRGFSRPDDNDPDALTGFVEFHVVAELQEAFVRVRDEKTYKWTSAPGYKLIVFENLLMPGGDWESFLVLSEEFKKEKLGEAVDAFMRETLNAQSWILIAESRSSLIPAGKDVFECAFCGCVTGERPGDIICEGCGKRFWGEELWGGGDDDACPTLEGQAQINK